MSRKLYTVNKTNKLCLKENVNTKISFLRMRGIQPEEVYLPESVISDVFKAAKFSATKESTYMGLKIKIRKDSSNVIKVA